MDEAELLQDDDRAARIQHEIDAFVAELGRAFGLGGRDRRLSSREGTPQRDPRDPRSDRPHRETHPAAGRELDRAIITGTYCSYQPAPDAAVVWGVRNHAFSRD
jgi:hypothetical protein